MNTAAALPMPGRQPEAYMRLAELLTGSGIAMALHIVAQRGIADELEDGPKSPEEMSPSAGIPVECSGG